MNWPTTNEQLLKAAPLAAVVIDDCDISDTGNYCVGPEMSCLTCRETAMTRYTDNGPDVEALDCGECMETIVERWM